MTVGELRDLLHELDDDEELCLIHPDDDSEFWEVYEFTDHDGVIWLEIGND